MNLLAHFARLALFVSLLDGVLAWPGIVAGGHSETIHHHFARALSDAVYPEPPPPAPIFTGPKLVNDAAHPWEPLRSGDIRGPCPGLNTLASHGVRACLSSRFPELRLTLLQYLPRDGVSTPNQIISAVTEGEWFPDCHYFTSATHGILT